LKVIPEWLAITGFGILLIFWTLVPFLDRKAHRGEKSPVFTYIGIAAILYLCVMTTWAYIAVGDERAQGAAEQIQQAPKQGGNSAK
jgi:quinol-cytochrome oxidoreductase complex cytochrome b subunit